MVAKPLCLRQKRYGTMAPMVMVGKHVANTTLPYSNAIMLVRILADNPGPTFTRNIDKKFTDTVKELLRNGRDPSVQQILRETLRSLYSDKAYDQNLNTLFQMWAKEPAGQQQQRGLASPPLGRAGREQYQPGFGQDQGGHRSNRKGLPAPAELAARIEEAKTSAKLLQQLIQSSVPEEILGNELIKEFAERCQAAQRSLGGYIACDSPPPDDATMQTLIDTSEQLGLAINKHQRAIMSARKVTGAPGALSTSPSPPILDQPLQNHQSLPPSQVPTTYSPPPGPPPATYAAPTQAPMQAPIQPTSTIQPSSLDRAIHPAQRPYQAPPQPTHNPHATHEDPFSDDYREEEANAVSPYQTYNPPLGPPPGRTAATDAPTQPLDQNLQRLQLNDREQQPASFTGPANSYHPGYQSTPSYMQRQESAQEHITMHGAASPPGTARGVDGEVSPIVERTPKTTVAPRY